MRLTESLLQKKMNIKMKFNVTESIYIKSNIYDKSQIQLSALNKFTYLVMQAVLSVEKRLV